MWLRIGAGAVLLGGLAASVLWLRAENLRRLETARRRLDEGDYPGARDALAGGVWLAGGPREQLREEIDRRDLADRIDRGGRFRREGRLDFAARCLRAAVELEPAPGRARAELEAVRADWLAKVRRLLGAERWQQARREAQAAAAQFPDDAAAARLAEEAAWWEGFAAATSAARRGDYAGAAGRLAEALAHLPAPPDRPEELHRRVAEKVSALVETVLAAAERDIARRQVGAAAAAINGAEQLAAAASLAGKYAPRIAQARARLGGRPGPDPDRAIPRQAALKARAAARAARAKALAAHADRCLPAPWAEAEALLAAGAGRIEADPNAAGRLWSRAGQAFADLAERALRARRDAEEARRRAAATRDAAEQADAPAAAAGPWQAAEKSRTTGEGHFAAHRYAAAADAYAAAAGLYEQAARAAGARRAFEADRKRQESALRKELGIPEGSPLEQWGGAAWLQVAQAAGAGTETGYRRAKQLLAAAAAAARKNWAIRQLAEHRRRLEAALERGDPAAARAELDGARAVAARFGLTPCSPSLEDLAGRIRLAEVGALLARAGSLAAAGRFAEARERLAEAAKVLPDDPRISAQRAGIDRAEYGRCLAAGRAALKAGRFAEALEQARRAGSLRASAGAHRDLLAEIERAVAAGPRRLRATGRFDQAGPALRRGLALLPDSAALKGLAAELKLLAVRYRPAERPLTGHDAWVYDVAAAPTGPLAVSGDGSGKALVWNLQRGVQVGRLAPGAGAVTCVAVSADGERIATGYLSGDVLLWSARPPYARIARLEGHTGMAIALAFSPDGKYLASGGFDSVARVWDASGRRKRPLATLGPHRHWVVSVAFSGDGELLATGCTRDDRAIRLWDWRPGRLVVRIPADPADAHSHDVHSLAFLRGGRTLLSASHDKTLRVWDTRTGRLTGRLAFEGFMDLSEVAVAPDGVRAACACRPGLLRFEVHVVDLVSGKTLQVLAGRHSDLVTAVTFALGGRAILSGSRDRKLQLWRADEMPGAPGAAAGPAEAPREP